MAEPDPTRPTLGLDLLPTLLAIVRLPAGSPIPQWTAAARDFLTISRTPSELSIVADAVAVPREMAGDDTYVAFRVRGPLALDLVGVFVALAGPLAAARVPIFPIATYDTDYLLVKSGDAARASRALEGDGHQVVVLG